MTIKNIALSLMGLAVAWFFAVSVPFHIARWDFEPFPLRLGALRFVGWLPIVLGAAVFLWCYGLFIVVGYGTPWHFDPPQKLVVAGPYRFVRNPMEASILAILLGEILLFESSGLIFYWIASFVLLHTRQVLVDEPALRRRFGACYERYLKSVPRWVPRLTGYKQES